MLDLSENSAGPVTGAAEVEIALAVAAHRGDGAVGLAAVKLDDDAGLRPVAVDQVATDANVEPGDGDLKALEEGDEAALERASGRASSGEDGQGAVEGADHVVRGELSFTRAPRGSGDGPRWRA